MARALLVEAEVEARGASDGNPESVELCFSLAVAGLYEELTAVLLLSAPPS